MSTYTAVPTQTERLLLRPFEAGDAPSVLDLYGREDVMRYLYEDPADEAAAERFVAHRSKNRTIDEDGGRVSLAVLSRESGAFVGDGMVDLGSVEHRQVEIGFVIHPDHQRRGYATELGRELLRIGFDELGAHRVFGRTEARNVASARVMEKLGMRREAHLVENEWVKDEWQSELVYAMLEREWRATRS